MENLQKAIEDKDYRTISTNLKSSPQENVVLALRHGCETGDVRLARIALQNLSGNVLSSIYKEEYLLHTACSKGHTNVAVLLLESGVPVDLLNDEGY